jgi:hypothetical protein
MNSPTLQKNSMAEAHDRSIHFPFRVHVTAEPRSFASISTPKFSYTPLYSASNTMERKLLHNGLRFNRSYSSLNRFTSLDTTSPRTLKAEDELVRALPSKDAKNQTLNNAQDDPISDRDIATKGGILISGRKSICSESRSATKTEARTKRKRGRSSSRPPSRAQEPAMENASEASAGSFRCTMVDLCEEDKEKIARLLRQVLELTEENDRLAEQLEMEKSRADESEKLAEASREEVSLVKHELETTSGKFTYSLSLLRAYQLRVREMQTALARSESALTAMNASRETTTRVSSPQRPVVIRNVMERDGNEAIRDVMDALEQASCALGPNTERDNTDTLPQAENFYDTETITLCLPGSATHDLVTATTRGAASANIAESFAEIRAVRQNTNSDTTSIEFTRADHSHALVGSPSSRHHKPNMHENETKHSSHISLSEPQAHHGGHVDENLGSPRPQKGAESQILSSAPRLAQSHGANHLPSSQQHTPAPKKPPPAPHAAVDTLLPQRVPASPKNGDGLSAVSPSRSSTRYVRVCECMYKADALHKCKLYTGIEVPTCNMHRYPNARGAYHHIKGTQ